MTRINFLRTSAFLVGLGLLIFNAGADVAFAQAPPPSGKFLRARNPIPNRYIVVLEESSLNVANLPSPPPNATPQQRDAVLRQRNDVIAQRVKAKAEELALAHRARLGHIFDHVLHGFAVELSEREAVALSQNPQVKYVEEDSEGSLQQINTP